MSSAGARAGAVVARRAIQPPSRRCTLLSPCPPVATHPLTVSPVLPQVPHARALHAASADGSAVRMAPGALASAVLTRLFRMLPSTCVSFFTYSCSSLALCPSLLLFLRVLGTLLGSTALPAVQYNLGVAAYMQQISTLPPLPAFSAAIPYLPADIDSVVASPEYSKDRDGWLWGNHPDFSSDRMQGIKDAVRKHKKAFAYQVTDLPGYHGKIPPFSIEPTTPNPVYTPPRRFSPLEVDVIDKKCEEGMGQYSVP